MQLSLTFNSVHPKENNKNSREFLELRREQFNKKCWQLLKRLLNGEQLTVLQAANSGISSLPRRAQDLIEHKGIPVRREWAVVNGVRQTYKIYYITEEDRLNVALRIIDLAKD